jgi:hypothetical protein
LILEQYLTEAVILDAACCLEVSKLGVLKSFRQFPTVAEVFEKKESRGVLSLEFSNH